MNDSPRKTTVTLEDLLRLKRAEQPPAEFWAEFERGMRAKQLAAIVEPRPWWAPFIRVGTRISRYQLPVGATAILAITLFTIREYHPVSSSSSFEPTASETASVPAPVTIGEKANPSDAVTAPAESNAVEVATNEQAPAIDMSPSRSDQATIAAATPVGEASHVAIVNSELSSARYVAELAAAQPADPALDQMLGHPLRSVENSPARGEPLAQISVQHASPLYRWQGATAQSASLSTGDSALRLNEQAARNLTERRLSESDLIGRLDVASSRVTVKF